MMRYDMNFEGTIGSTRLYRTSKKITFGHLPYFFLSADSFTVLLLHQLVPGSKSWNGALF